jgi:hypothetical protein
MAAVMRSSQSRACCESPAKAAPLMLIEIRNNRGLHGKTFIYFQ